MLSTIVYDLNFLGFWIIIFLILFDFFLILLTCLRLHRIQILQYSIYVFMILYALLWFALFFYESIGFGFSMFLYDFVSDSLRFCVIALVFLRLYRIHIFYDAVWFALWFCMIIFKFLCILRFCRIHIR